MKKIHVYRISKCEVNISCYTPIFDTWDDQVVRIKRAGYVIPISCISTYIKRKQIIGMVVLLWILIKKESTLPHSQKHKRTFNRMMLGIKNA